MTSSAKAEAGGKLAYSLSYFTLFAIYGVASPYLQLLLQGLGYGPAAVGFFLGFFEVIGIVGPLALSKVADKSPRSKPYILICAALIILPLAPLVLIRQPLIAALCLAMLSFGLRSMVPLIDASTIAMINSRRGWDYGKLRAMGSAGFVAVALTLQLIPGFDHSPPERIAIWIGATAIVFALCLIPLPEARRGEAALAAEKAEDQGTAPGVKGKGALGERMASGGAAFALGLAVIALGRLAMAPVSSFFSLYLVDEVKWDAVGGMWALAALSEIPLMVLSGRIVAKLGPMRATMIGTAAIALRLAIYALFPSPAGVVSAQLLHSLCFGLLHPAGVAFVALMVPPERRSQGMALYMGVAVGLPTFLGSALGGIIAQSWGYRPLFGSFILFAFAGMALYLAKRKKIEAA
jgi:Arabinose efflux permease